MRQEVENDVGDVDDEDAEQNEFRIGDDSCTILDEYLGGDELKELMMEEGNIFDNDLSLKDLTYSCLRRISIKKH